MEAYAHRLVEQAVSLRPGQDLFIRGPEELHKFGLLIGDVAYQKGARSVHYHFPRPGELAQLVSRGSFDHIKQYHEGIRDFYSEITKRGAASLSLVHDFTPPSWNEEAVRSHPENFDYFMQGMSDTHTLFDEAILHQRFPHATAPVAIDSWAKTVFHESEDPLHDLWTVIDHAANNDNYGVRKERAQVLDSLLIREIHITGGGNGRCSKDAPREASKERHSSPPRNATIRSCHASGGITSPRSHIFKDEYGTPRRLASQNMPAPFTRPLPPEVVVMTTGTCSCDLHKAFPVVRQAI